MSNQGIYKILDKVDQIYDSLRDHSEFFDSIDTSTLQTSISDEIEKTRKILSIVAYPLLQIKGSLEQSLAENLEIDRAEQADIKNTFNTIDEFDYEVGLFIRELQHASMEGDDKNNYVRLSKKSA